MPCPPFGSGGSRVWRLRRVFGNVKQRLHGFFGSAVAEAAKTFRFLIRYPIFHVCGLARTGFLTIFLFAVVG